MAASRGLSWLKAVGVAAVVATPVAVTIEDWLFTVVKCKDALMQVRFGLGFEWSERAAARLDLEVSVGWVSASSRGMLGGELLRSWENRNPDQDVFLFFRVVGSPCSVHALAALAVSSPLFWATRGIDERCAGFVYWGWQPTVSAREWVLVSRLPRWLNLDGHFHGRGEVVYLKCAH
jgi:hypothetical protein